MEKSPPTILRCVLAMIVGAAAWAAPAAGDEKTDAANPKQRKTPITRKVRFFYHGAIDQLKPGAAARIWLPLAPNAFEQKVEIVKIALPAKHRMTREARFGNRLAYFEANANDQGEIPFAVEYLVERREVLRGDYEPVRQSELAPFLDPIRPAPAEGFLGLLLLGNDADEKEPLMIGKEIYAAVDGLMRYDKPAGGGWGRGDALWACQSGYGNCTDFHSLFIAASREARLPGRFEIGFSLPAERGRGDVAGYHCWAKFAADGRWVPVDISEADKHPDLKDYYFGNLTADRVLFTVGRDLQLTPPQHAGPVNFLIYPYVEVEGKTHTSFALAFRFEDLP